MHQAWKCRMSFRANTTTKQAPLSTIHSRFAGRLRPFHIKAAAIRFLHRPERYLEHLQQQQRYICAL
jgi:hypothetical protein